MERDNSHIDLLGASAPFFMAGIAVATGVVLSQFAFTNGTRRIIWERDGGKCVDCGSTEHLECSHIDHNRANPEYNSPDNGMLQCVKHHLAYHLKFRKNPAMIGLSKNHNDHAIKSLQKRANT